MSNPWSGQVAKTIGNRKHSRRYWNIILCSFLLVILLVMLIFIHQVLGDYIAYSFEGVYIEYTDGCLVTNDATFSIPEREKQEIHISNLTYRAESGDRLTFTVSKLSGDLLEISSDGEILYRKIKIDLIPAISGWAIAGLPVIGLCIFMLIVTNIEKPGKRIAKLQNEFLLKIHK